MQKQKVLYFDIEGISCGGCAAKIEAGLQCDKIEAGLQLDRDIKEIKINVATKRARVEVKDSVHPNEVIQKIKAIDDKFVAHWLAPKNAKDYYFSITGMKSVADRNRIQRILDEHKDDFIKSEVNYSTGIVTITSIVSKDPEKNKQQTEYFSKLIESSTEGNMKIHVQPFESPIKEEYIKTYPTRSFHRKALINALVGSFLFLISGFIPLPLTPIGQMCGVFIGGLTMGVMWTTGREFYTEAWKKFVKDHSFDMNTLIALGTGSAWIYSMIIALFPTLFPIVALQYHFLAINMILGIVNFGKGLRANAEEKTKSKILKLGQVYVKLQPQHATKLNINYYPGLEKDIKTIINNSVEIPYLNIKEGDLLYVPEDKRFPVEGVIVSKNETMVNDELRTGETAPNNKKELDNVLSGSLNTKHPVIIRATTDGPNGQLTKTIDLMDRASGSKPSISGKIDRLAAMFVPAIILISILTAMGWLLFGPAPVLPWLIKSVMSVYLCACPCGWLLGFPIAVEVGVGKLYSKKILVKEASTLETASQISTVVFDKTGVLTKPAVNMEESVFTPDWPSKIVMLYVASLEVHYKHPIATAITSIHSKEELLACENWQQGEEGGISGKVDNYDVLVGNDSHLRSHNITIPKHFADQEGKNANKGMSSVYVAINGVCVGVIALHQEIRHDAKQTIKALQDRDIEVYMLTGDKKDAAKAVAKKIGISSSKCIAECTSQDKAKIIRSLKAREVGGVAMVGDEVNDTYAMDAADVSISFGSWTNVASNAKVVISQLSNLMHLLLISKETMKVIDQNLYWTGFYNLLSLMAATGLLYSVFGFVLNPIVASMGMTLSSIFVVLNSLRLNYRIDYVIDFAEKKIPPPKIFFEKVKHFFAANGLFQLLKDTLYDNKPQRKPQDKPQKQPQGGVQRKTTPAPNIPTKEFTLNRSPAKNSSSYQPIVIDDEKSGKLRFNKVMKL